MIGASRNLERPRRRAGLGLAVLSLSTLIQFACSTPEVGVPVFTVESREFHHKISAEGELRAAKTTQLMVPNDARTAVRLAWLAPEGSLVSAGQVVARFDGKAMEEKLLDSQSDLQSQGLELEKAEINSQSTLDGLRKDLEVAKIELRHAEAFQKTDSEVFSRRTIQEDALDAELARERKHHAQSSAGTRRSLAQTEKDLLLIRKQQVQMEIERVKKGLQALEVTAPHDGVLTLVQGYRGTKPSIGMEMWRGQPVAEIPDLAKMEAYVFVLEADAGGLAEGLSADVVVEAHPERTHKATIKSVEAVAKPRFPNSPVQYFGVVLGLETTDPEVMKPGGRVRVTLHLEHRDQAVVVPRQSLFQLPDEDQQRDGVDENKQEEQGVLGRVYVRKGDEFEARRVKVGATSLGSVVIESGLQPGEVVALAEPWGPEAGAPGIGGGAGTVGGLP